MLNFSISCLHCIVSKKVTTFHSYIVFCPIKNGFNFNPETSISDYEDAIHLGALKVWSTTHIIGCNFHLGLSWYYKIKNLSLATEYQLGKNDVSKFFNHLFGLKFALYSILWVINPQPTTKCGEVLFLSCWYLYINRCEFFSKNVGRLEHEFF